MDAVTGMPALPAPEQKAQDEWIGLHLLLFPFCSFQTLYSKPHLTRLFGTTGQPLNHPRIACHWLDYRTFCIACEMISQLKLHRILHCSVDIENSLSLF
jgi:hypothetical protein